MAQPTQPDEPPLRRGVIAVIVRDGKLLTIVRSDQVAAPGALCFPGGGIEGDETEPAALRRELREELGVEATPSRKLWHSQTAWRVDLAWWQADLASDAVVSACDLEVASFDWLSAAEMARDPRLLSSNQAFLSAWAAGEFEITGLSPPEVGPEA